MNTKKSAPYNKELETMLHLLQQKVGKLYVVRRQRIYYFDEQNVSPGDSLLFVGVELKHHKNALDGLELKFLTPGAKITFLSCGTDKKLLKTLFVDLL